MFNLFRSNNQNLDLNISKGEVPYHNDKSGMNEILLLDNAV